MNIHDLNKSVIRYKVDHIETPEDIEFVQIEIGKIRLNAERAIHIRTKSYLHKLANELEEDLKIKIQKGFTR
jgi:hypothetical protein